MDEQEMVRETVQDMVKDVTGFFFTVLADEHISDEAMVRFVRHYSHQLPWAFKRVHRDPRTMAWFKEKVQIIVGVRNQMDNED